MSGSFFQDFLVGSISASIGKTAVAPLERVKLLLQLQHASTQMDPNKHYKGITDCFKRVYHEQGFLSFWRGNLANVLRYFPTQAFNFAIKDFLNKHFNKYNKKENFRKFMIANILSGGFAGTASLLVGYPLDFIRTRLAVDIGKLPQEREFKSLTDCALKIVKHDGILGLYKGTLISIPIFFVYRGLYFGLYDSYKDSIPPGRFDFLIKFALAQSVTIFAGLFVYPLDTVRRRLMMQAGRKDVIYENTLDCFKKIYANEGGSKAFFKGALANLIRSAGGALILVFYDSINQKLFGIKKHSAH